MFRRRCGPGGRGARVDARLHRSHPGAAAVRARGSPAARRAALHLCGASPGRRGPLICVRMRRRRAAGSPRRRSCWCCREAGSARSERLLGVFADTVALLRDRVGPLEVVVPTVPHLAEPDPRRNQAMAAAAADRRRDGGEAGCVSHRPGRAGEIRHRHARACSRRGSDRRSLTEVSWLEAVVGRRLIKRLVRSFSPIWCSERTWCRSSSRRLAPAENLAAAVLPLLADTPERRRQIEAFSRLDAIMEIGSKAPATRAADIVLAAARRAMPRDKRARQLAVAVPGTDDAGPIRSRLHHLRREIGT